MEKSHGLLSSPFSTETTVTHSAKLDHNGRVPKFYRLLDEVKENPQVLLLAPGCKLKCIFHP